MRPFLQASARAEVAIIFYREAGIFCLHNIYPTTNAESNGLRFPGETNEIGTKTTPLSGASLRRTDDVECGHRDKFQRNGKIVQSAQTQMLTNRQRNEREIGWKCGEEKGGEMRECYLPTIKSDVYSVIRRGNR